MRNRFTYLRRVSAAAFAYLFAVQALLAVWTVALAPARAAFDPLSATCLTTAGDDTQTPIRSRDHGIACHCATACAGGHCCASGSLAGRAVNWPNHAALVVDYDPGRAAADHATHAAASSARGPPSV